MSIHREHPKGAGKCAKQTVLAVLFTPDGDQFISSNYCLNPQASCPRTGGEGYEKCKTICQQPGHAEANAIRMAGDRANGGTCLVFGHRQVCDSCRTLCEERGIGFKVLGV